MLGSGFQKFWVTTATTHKFKKWGERICWQGFNKVHFSLFFSGLSAVSNTIILLKYFNLKPYYSTIKSVIPLPDIHRDTAFCPFQNAMAALLPHCKFQQTSTFTVFHHHSTFFPVSSLSALFHSLPFPPLLPFHLGPSRWERTKRDSNFSIQGRSCPVTDYIDVSLGAVRPSTAHKLGLQLQDGGSPTASGWLGASAGQAGSNPLQTAWRHHLGSDPAWRRPGITCTTATVSSNWLVKKKKKKKGFCLMQGHMGSQKHPSLPQSKGSCPPPSATPETLL